MCNDTSPGALCTKILPAPFFCSLYGLQVWCMYLNQQNLREWNSKSCFYFPCTLRWPPSMHATNGTMVQNDGPVWTGTIGHNPPVLQNWFVGSWQHRFLELFGCGQVAQKNLKMRHLPRPSMHELQFFTCLCTMTAKQKSNSTSTRGTALQGKSVVIRSSSGVSMVLHVSFANVSTINRKSKWYLFLSNSTMKWLNFWSVWERSCKLYGY